MSLKWVKIDLEMTFANFPTFSNLILLHAIFSASTENLLKHFIRNLTGFITAAKQSRLCKKDFIRNIL